jgi:hypothetical protein
MADGATPPTRIATSQYELVLDIMFSNPMDDECTEFATAPLDTIADVCKCIQMVCSRQQQPSWNKAYDYDLTDADKIRLDDPNALRKVRALVNHCRDYNLFFEMVCAIRNAMGGWSLTARTSGVSCAINEHFSQWGCHILNVEALDARIENFLQPHLDRISRLAASRTLVFDEESDEDRDEQPFFPFPHYRRAERSEGEPGPSLNL